MARIRALDVFFASYGNVDLNNVTRLLIHFDRGSLGKFNLFDCLYSNNNTIL